MQISTEAETTTTGVPTTTANLVAETQRCTLHPAPSEHSDWKGFTSWTERNRRDRQTHRQNLQFQTVPLPSPHHDYSSTWDHETGSQDTRGDAQHGTLARPGPRLAARSHVTPYLPGQFSSHLFQDPTVLPQMLHCLEQSRVSVHGTTLHSDSPDLNEVLSSRGPLRTHIPQTVEEASASCFLAALS